MAENVPIVIKLNLNRNKVKLDAFMSDFRENAWHVHGNFYTWEDKILFEVYAFDGSIHLAAIQSAVEPRKGHGSRALDWFLRLADKHDVQVEGSIKRIGTGKERLTYIQLRSWYARHGFKVEGRKKLSYEPNAPACDSLPKPQSRSLEP